MKISLFGIFRSMYLIKSLLHLDPFLI